MSGTPCRFNKSVYSQFDKWFTCDPESANSVFEQMVSESGISAVSALLASDYLSSKREAISLLRSTDVFEPYEGDPKVIALFDHRMCNGGVERVLSTLSFMLVEKGYQVVVITERGPLEGDYELPPSVPHVALCSKGSTERERQFNRASSWASILDAYSVDVVVHNLSWDRNLFWDLLAIKAARRGAVLYFHGSAPYFFFGARDTSWIDLLNCCDLFDACVVVSECDKAFWGAISPHVEFIPNPINFDLDDVVVSDLGSKDIVWLGRLSEEKNPLDAVPIFAAVHDYIPESRLRIVGKSENGKMEKTILAQIKNYGLGDSVELCGFHSDVAPFLRSSSIYLQTSSFESFSMSLYEAFSYGVPAVIYDLPNIEFSRYGQGMISVDRGDQDAAAAAIVRILENDDLLTSMGKEARASAERMNSIDVAGSWDLLLGRVGKSRESVEGSGLDGDRKLMIKSMGLAVRNYQKVLAGEIRKEKSDAKKAAANASKKTKDIRKSNSWRIGRALTWPARFIKRLKRAVVKR